MNKKITLYELLGLVKDGKAPKKIKITDFVYEYQEAYEWYFHKPDGKIYDVALGGVSGEINLPMSAFNKSIEILDDEDKNNFTGWKMYQNGKEVASMDCSYDEDMEIEDVKLIELSSNGILNDTYTEERHYLTANLKDKDIYVRKINQLIKNQQILVREINKLKKEGK